MMYIEFKRTIFDVHIWDKKGAMTQLAGDEILQYVLSYPIHLIYRMELILLIQLVVRFGF